MIKTLAKSIREFKKPSILTPILIIGEVIIEDVAGTGVKVIVTKDVPAKN